MLKATKKTLALFIALCMLFPLIAGAARQATAAAEPYYTIYIRGSTTIYKFSDDGTKSALYDDGDYIADVLSKAMPLLPAARMSGDYTAYANKVLEIMRPAYDSFRPSLTDGTVPADTHVEWYWTPETVARDVKARTYIEYWTDERLSPFAQAEDLNRFVEEVRKATGINKFLFYGRCLGPVAMFTYLYEYQRPKNYADVYGVELSFSTHAGMALTDAAYTGDGYVDDAALQSWLTFTAANAVEGSAPAAAARIVRQLVDGIGGSLGIRMTVKELNNLYAKLKDVLFRPLILEYYGLCLSYMACVNKRFDDMMKYLFPTKADRKTYAYAVGELTRYHETVWPAINGMLQDVLDQGKPVAIFADYGGQQYPVSADAMELGDYQVGTASQSLGATTCNIGGTLSNDYVLRQQRRGLGRYISPDKKVDASTCAFPDNTFFVANLNHSWSGKYAGYELDMIHEHRTVNSDPAYPQFLYYDFDTEKLVPLADVVNAQPETPEETTGGFRAFLARMLDFFRRIIARIRGLFAFVNG